MRRRMTLCLALALSGCAVDRPSAPVAGPAPASSPAPGSAPALPVRVDCAAPRGPVTLGSGATVAVLATAETELTLFLVDDVSGCWTRLDAAESPARPGTLVAHPGGRLLFAPGELSPMRAGVAVYAILERGSLDRLGTSELGERWFDDASYAVATEEAVYLASTGRSTGYHGGFWWWSLDPGRGQLSWRGSAGPARDPWFLRLASHGPFVYLGTESYDPSFHTAVVTYRVLPGGVLTRVSETTVGGRLDAVVDPAGNFVWLVDAGSRGTLDAYRTVTGGGLGAHERVGWDRGLPVVHPGGGVLYAASNTHVEAHAVDPLSGIPRLLADVRYAGALFRPLAMHPSGRFVYVAGREEVHAFTTQADGRLEDYGRVAAGGSRLLLTRLP